MALWQQQSPYLAKTLTHGLLRGVQRDASRNDVFEFVSCQLEVDIGPFKQGEWIDKVQLNFMDGTIQMCNRRGEFHGLLGWNVRFKGKCLWSSVESKDFLFKEDSMSIELDGVHYYDCIMRYEVPPFQKGEFVPHIIIDWKNQRIKMFDDPSGRLFEGVVGWCILDHAHQFVSFANINRRFAGQTPGTRSKQEFDFGIPSLVLPPPLVNGATMESMRYLSDKCQ